MKCRTFLLSAVLLACGPPRASRDDCRVVLVRIIEIELQELGYRDPELLAAKQRELLHRFESNLTQCTGRILSEDSRQCVAAASSTEMLVHDCLQ